MAARGLEPTLEDENGVTPEQAAGQRQVHTLEVNDVGLAFMEAARQREELGDECGPLAWRHEVWHWIEPPDGRQRGVGTTADAVLRYTTTAPRVRVHAALIELDRATVEPHDLVEQLAKYGQLHSASGSWQSMYGREFPRVLVVFAGHARASRERLEARMRRTVALAREREPLMTAALEGRVRVYFTLLEHLTARGPFARIWARLDAPEKLVGWLDDEQARLRVVDPGED